MLPVEGIKQATVYCMHDSLKKDPIWSLKISQLRRTVRNMNNLTDCVKCNDGDLHSISWEHRERAPPPTCQGGGH